MNKLFENTYIFRLPELSEANITTNATQFKGLVILASEHDLNPENKAKLDQILMAIKYDPDQNITVVTTGENDHISISKMIGKTSAKDVLVFGLTPAQMSLNIKVNKYEWAQFENAQILFSDSLEILKDSKELKNQLWASLKNYFLK